MASPKKRTKPVVKRKRKKSSGRKKKSHFSFSTFAFSVRSIIIWAILLTIAFILLLFLYDYYYPQDKEGEIKIEQKGGSVSQDDNNAATEETPVAVFDSSSDENTTIDIVLSFEKDAEIPRLTSNRKEQILAYEGYTVSYNIDHKLANWVAWELTAEEALSTKVERSNNFSCDPALEGKTALNEDYTRSGYDRGHLAPAGDMKWSAKAMQESFYFSNICPQDRELNSGLWKDLEEQSRIWATSYESLLIITGPVMEDGLKKLGKNRVSIPNKFYKVIATVAENEYQGIAFLFENKDYKNTSLKTLAIPIDSVERVTDIDFFHILPTEYERVMESSVNISYWFN